MEEIVPTKIQLEQMKKSLEGWRERLEILRNELIEGGATAEEAQRAIDPQISFYLGKEEEVNEFETFYKMEESIE